MFCCACEETLPPGLPVVSVTVSVSSITPSFASFKVSASPQNIKFTTGIIYGTDPNLQSGTQEATSSLMSLESGTTYYCKGYIADKLNNRIFSEIQSFTTQTDGIEFGNGIAAAANFGRGDGTQNNPYLISTPRQLKKLVDGGKYSGIYFRLNTDIHVTADEWIPIGETFTSTSASGLHQCSRKEFYGNFDGGGHTISGALKTSIYSYFGFFSLVGGSISNLIIAADVQNRTKISELSYVTTGGVVGCLSDGIITNCTVSGDVIDMIGKEESGPAYQFAGGIAGECAGRTITNCTMLGSVTSNGPHGGIVGMSWNGHVENCTNRGVVQGSGSIGGIVGYNHDDGTVHTSLNTGSIMKSDENNDVNQGGLVGFNSGHVYSCCTNTGLVNGQPATNANQIGIDYYGRGIEPEPCPDGHTKR